ncbi:hypothetical protein [Kitasatospora camelliae]|uniref:Integral membrane protein n=1 Tax=Kitasatospora camelliae TaxID=3156397 RepID=A0AAU8JY14_9ACTN
MATAATPGGPGAPPADPVRALLLRHRELCEQAVDVLEIAAGLEDAGVDRETLARCRHADVFGLAEELYARVPRRPPAPVPDRPPVSAGVGREAVRAALAHAVPVSLLALLAAVLPGPAALPAAWALLPAAAALAWAAPAGTPVLPRAGYGLGTALLLAPGAASGGTGAVLAVAAGLGAGPAAAAALRIRRAGRTHLGTAATLAEFRSRMRPVLPVAAAVQLAVLAGLSFAALLAASAPTAGPWDGPLDAAAHRAGPLVWAAQAATGLLLLAAAVLLRGGREVLGAAAVLAAGCAAAGWAAAGTDPAAARLTAAGAVAAGLLGYAWPLLGRISSHRPRPD